MIVRRAVIAGAAVAAFAVPAHAKAPSEDWPRITGQTWLNSGDRDRTKHGSKRNDKLLGGHGDDTIFGERGADVIWGDYKPSGQPSSQKDVIDAGPGNDWVYGSHGHSRILGGPGNDTIRVWFGRGVVDCGEDRDILYVSRKSHKRVTIRNCERISHKSARQAAGGR